MPGQGAIGWPTIGDTLTAHVRVVTDAGIDSASRPGGPSVRHGPASQAHHLPSTAVSGRYRRSRFVQDGDTVGTEPLLLTVETVPVDTAAGFRDIKDIAELPFSWRYWWKQNWPYVAGAAGPIAVLAFVVWRLRKPTGTRRCPRARNTTSPASRRVLQALDDLERRRLCRMGR